MTPSPINLLTGTSEHDSVDDLDSEALKKLAETPASELSVRMSHHNCWAKRWIRSFRVWLAVGFGLALAVQVFGVVIVSLWLDKLNGNTAKIVRDTVAEVLKEHGVSRVDMSDFREFLAQDHPIERTP